MKALLPYEAELLRRQTELKDRFANGTNSEKHDSQFTSDIYVKALFDHSIDINQLRQTKFSECIESYKDGGLDAIEQSVLRILGLGQAQDYVPAILWLGAFSEKILEDFDEAAYYYRRAASLDSGEGMFLYGMLMLNEKIPTPPNVSVKRCFTDAAEHGVSEAHEIIAEHWGENTSSNSKAQDTTPISPAVKFYNDCVAEYHKVAQEHGFATKGVIFIPELIPIGEKTILALLQDWFFQMQFRDDVQTYYYVIMSLALQAGIVFAAKWHSGFPALQSGYVDQIIEEGPADACKPLLRILGLSDAEKENAFYRVVYERWMDLHEPYWKLNDPREYTFKATLAAYQLGVSMLLEKYGY